MFPLSAFSTSQCGLWVVGSICSLKLATYLWFSIRNDIFIRYFIGKSKFLVGMESNFCIVFLDNEVDSFKVNIREKN